MRFLVSKRGKMPTELTQAQLDLAQAELKLKEAQIKDGDNHVSESQRESEVMQAIEAVIEAEEALIEETEEEGDESWAGLEAAEKRIAVLETRLTEMQASQETRHSEVLSRLDGLKPSPMPLNPEPSPTVAIPLASPEQLTAPEKPKEQPVSVPERRKIRKI